MTLERMSVVRLTYIDAYGNKMRAVAEPGKGIGSAGVTQYAALRFPNFAHVSIVYSGHLPIVPGDRNRIPTRFGDNATIGGIAR